MQIPACSTAYWIPMSEVEKLFEFEQYRSLSAASIAVAIVLLLIVCFFAWLRCISSAKKVVDTYVERLPIQEDDGETFSFSELAQALGIHSVDIDQLRDCGVNSLETLAHTPTSDLRLGVMAPSTRRRIQRLKFLAVNQS